VGRKNTQTVSTSRTELFRFDFIIGRDLKVFKELGTDDLFFEVCILERKPDGFCVFDKTMVIAFGWSACK